MKANELRCKDLMIGNWVMVNDIEHAHPLQVAELFMKSGTLYATLYWDGMPYNVNPETLTADVDKVLPIPLTPEILEKNGFVENRGVTSWKFETDREDLIDIYGVKDYHLSINIEDTHGSGKGYRWMLNNLTIFYVHQLQHALRLCGIEKTIEL